jgi:hypothetical protein
VKDVKGISFKNRLKGHINWRKAIFKTKKIRTLDEMFKKISESSENYPEQLAHTS